MTRGRSEGHANPGDDGLPHVVILGAGPAGLGAAYRLRQTAKARVTVVEQRDTVGGNAGSFELDRVMADYGSHRLHPECAPDVLADLRRLLGDDLLARPRNGRIRLRGRWVRFPLSPVDLLTHLPTSFIAGAARDAITRPLRGSGNGDSFAGVMERKLGATLCRDFYFPYARKVWGLAPEEISAVQAQKRVSADSPLKLVRKAAGAVPLVGSRSSRAFYYPKHGYGQISQRLFEEGTRLGGRYLLGHTVTAVKRDDARVTDVVVRTPDGKEESIGADYVWSTVPMPLLARLVQPAAPPKVLAAAGAMETRAMILVYLVLDTGQFTQYDAHYFPEEHIAITRLSEPKNYSGAVEPTDRTVLCAELPCDPDSGLWKESDAALGDLALRSLEDAGLPVRVPVRSIVVHRLRHAYPVYRVGFEEYFDTVDQWLRGIDGLLTFGRQGLFAHDNAHHALDMAYSAVACLRQDGRFDRERWGRFRVAFEQNVVVD